ncbi:MAG TPA: tRNA preQ1(34) S-adenosylmethionine ribosyltransferase-isomerase QueA [Gemmatimonadales bacterium]|nr:tRNA preQ1(34) S-adenosylmethionine ribosyltransferase-isomerase QueA [Gemmatimonadales bacterium]
MTAGSEPGDFTYELPPDLIAQEPLSDRAASRLLVLDRTTGSIEHRVFRDLLALIAPEDTLVVNTSRVIPARLLGVRESPNGERKPAELLLVRPAPDDTWLAMGHPGGKLKPGRRIHVGPDVTIEILEALGGGMRRVRFTGALDAAAAMAKYGVVPLPPYIDRDPRPADRGRYQTVYAEHDGSVAAPTAGLHFTPELLAAIERRGIARVALDLHIGPGTFKPVAAEHFEGHIMHAEAYAVSPEAAAAINARRAAGGRVWAVGTSVVRTLETTADVSGVVHAGQGETRLFIHPPYRWRVVDKLITNFHLPRSTLLMLVSAFGGYEPVMRAYRAAVADRYRFYSYGDAMAIV